MVGGVLLVGGFLLWGAQGLPRATPVASPRQVPPRTAGRAQAASPSQAGAAPRNIFEFDDGAPLAREEGPPRPPAPVVTMPSADLSPPSTLPEPAVRLVGIVLRGGKRKAALAIRGELAVIGPGETADGYTVLAIDDENGVRLTGPEGEIRLAPPSGSPGD